MDLSRVFADSVASNSQPATPTSNLQPAGDEPRLSRPRKRLVQLAVLVVGGVFAAYLAGRAPREQHLRLLLASASTRVVGIGLQYVGEDGDVVRDVRMKFAEGKAPRVVAHAPELANGDYHLRIDLETREGRRSVQRRVTLGGGTIQVDLDGVVSPNPDDAHSDSDSDSAAKLPSDPRTKP